MMIDRARAAPIPLLSLVLGFGPALMLLAAGAAAWLLPPPTAAWVGSLGRLWAGVMLVFLAGVRRGLTFAQEAPPAAPVLVAIAIFLTGMATLLLPAGPALAAAVLGFATVGLADMRDARAGRAPAHFARLRPWQMALFLAGTALLLVRLG